MKPNKDNLPIDEQSEESVTPVEGISPEISTAVVEEAVVEETAATAAEVKKTAPAEAEAALNEFRELAEAESEQWDYLPKPPRRLRRKRHLFLRLFISMFIVYAIAFGVTARLVFGKGWLKNRIDGNDNQIRFTLPIAELPKLDDKFYQADGSGRYTVEGITEAVTPSIVTIESYAEGAAFGAYGQGSGIIMSADGYIITNAHVIADATLSIKVRLHDGSEYNAAVVGSDAKSDIAVIKITAAGLQAAQFGNSDAVTRGEQVVAIGTPAGLEGSVTTGIVSGVDRMIKVDTTNISMSCIQIDAAINPGNSGGALVNMWGQVIGITSSKLDAIEYDNIGFAIEMSAASPIIEELIENGAVLGRPRIGISFYETSEAAAEFYGTPAGLEIVEISPDCDIANTELMIGDYITEINGIEVRSSDDVYAIILDMHPGDKVTAHVVRVLPTGKLKEFDIEFMLMPDSFISESDDQTESGAEEKTPFESESEPKTESGPEPETDPNS